MRHRYSLFLLLLLSGYLTAQTAYPVPDHHHATDSVAGTILARLDLETVNADGAPKSGVVLNGRTYRFSATRATLDYGTAYTVRAPDDRSYRLSFTQLPLIVLQSADSIPLEGRVPATFSYADDEQTLTADLGVRFRGNYSLMFPRRSLDLEFWEDPSGEDNRDVTFGNLREDDDWIMDGIYNEPLRVNSYVAHKVWLDMHTPHYLEDEPRARAGADVMIAEAFLNGRYNGVYLLSEQVDRKQLRLKKFKDGEIRGELYKANQWSDPVRFRGTVPLSQAEGIEWGRWEMKLPDPDDTLDWTRLFDLVDFVANSPDEEFRRRAPELFELDNMIDYLIYVNVLRLGDNTAKNTYLGRYEDGATYFYTPWDLDGSFGNRFDGTDIPNHRGWLTNNLFRRLNELSPAGFNSRLCARYEALRSPGGLLHPDSLMQRLTDQMDYLRRNGVYRREAEVYPEALDVSNPQVNFTRSFIERRIAWLDGQFCNLSVSTTDVVDPAQLRLFPNPASGEITVVRDHAGVQDYAITAVSGRRLAQGRLTQPRQTISLAGFPPGVYVLTAGGHALRLVVAR